MPSESGPGPPSPYEPVNRFARSLRGPLPHPVAWRRSRRTFSLQRFRAGQDAARRCDPLCHHPHQTAPAISRQWNFGTRQQHSRTGYAFHSHRPKKLVIRRVRTRRQVGCNRLYPDRNRKSQWCRSASLANRHPCLHRRSQDHAS